MRPQGGTELLYQSLVKRLQSELEKVNLIVSVCSFDTLSNTKPNILWQHLHIDQPNVQLLHDPNYVNQLNQLIFVSEWQKNQFISTFPAIDPNKCVVLRNAIDPIPAHQKPKDKPNLIYTSMPNRGLEVLLEVFARLDRTATLTIFSSNIIYGDSYSRSIGAKYDHLFLKAKSMKNVFYRGFAMNNVVRQELEKAHFLVYPSIFPETSCVSAIEAGSAGCKIITTKFGALPETCGDWAEYTDFVLTSDLIVNYTVNLQEAIDNYIGTYQSQVEWFNARYSWGNRIQEWKMLLDNL
jgi:UDP-glucose:(glucosyl)LPS alpha-1,2-glucosyltransferase